MQHFGAMFLERFQDFWEGFLAHAAVGWVALWSGGGGSGSGGGGFWPTEKPHLDHLLHSVCCGDALLECEKVDKSLLIEIWAWGLQGWESAWTLFGSILIFTQ